MCSILSLHYRSGTITITFLASSDPEPVEVFTVRLNSPTNSATIDSDGAVSQITVSPNYYSTIINKAHFISLQVRQEGMPYGVIGFFGESLNIQEVPEADIVQTVTFPISRTQGNLGIVEVKMIPSDHYNNCSYCCYSAGFICSNSRIRRISSFGHISCKWYSDRAIRTAILQHQYSNSA